MANAIDINSAIKYLFSHSLSLDFIEIREIKNMDWAGNS